MRVLLVRSPSVLGRMARQNLQHPTNLLGLASELNARGHRATILDLEVVPGGADRLAAVLAAERPGLVGFSVVTPHVPGAAALAAVVRRALPDTFLIAGGPHATALPADLLDEIPELDAVCVGEGDESFPALCAALESAAGGSARRAALDAIPGLQLRDGPASPRDSSHGVAERRSHIADASTSGSSPGASPSGDGPACASTVGSHFTGARDVLSDLDRLAPMDRSLLDWPAYERLAGHKGVASPGVIRKGIRATQIHLSRGCYAHCVFCSTNLVWGERSRPGIRRRSLPAVLEEIDRVVADFGVNHLNFEDDIFPPTLHYLQELCTALLTRRVTWSCNARVDGLRREHFELMAAAGCVKIDFGVESGSERILELNRKLVTVDKVLHVFAESQRVGILRTAYLMLGSHVDETPAEVEQTAALARRIRPDYITFTVGCPYPGTELWNQCRERGFLALLPTGRPDWKRYGYYPGLPPWRFTHFTPEQMLATQQRVLRGFYMNPAFMLRMLARVRSVAHMKALVTAGLDVRHFLASELGARHARHVRDATRAG
ncbi:MAG TPA: radical SAM protein [Planctomycetota bacterium]|nr:radical SAM protein [Planctomycetota bacterium]